MTRRDVNEAVVVQYGLNTLADEQSATKGQVPTVGSDGNVGFASVGGDPGDLARAEYFNPIPFLPPLNGSWAQVEWSPNNDNPAAPLDLSDPTKPLVIEAGIYSIAATIQYNSGGTNKLARVELQLDPDGFDWLMDASITADPLIESGQASLGMTIFLAAGQAIILRVQQFDDATPYAPNVAWYVAVQRIA